MVLHSIIDPHWIQWVVENNWQPFLGGIAFGWGSYLGLDSRRQEKDRTKWDKEYVVGKHYRVVINSAEQGNNDLEDYVDYNGKEVIAARSLLKGHGEDAELTVQLVVPEFDMDKAIEKYNKNYAAYIKEYKDWQSREGNAQKRQQEYLQAYYNQVGGYGGGAGGSGGYSNSPEAPIDPRTSVETFDIPIVFLQDLDKDTQNKKIKKGGFMRRMPAIFRWSLYAALVSAVWQIVNNLPVIAQFFITKLVH